MNELTFTKMHGSGNDFVVFDATRRPVRLSAAMSRRLCDRHLGVGADQILVLERSVKADFRMRIINSDGSLAEMCGNGMICLARYVRENGLTKKTDLVFETPAGLIRPSVRPDGLVRVDMGEPILDAARIPTADKGRVIDKPLRFDGGKAAVTAVSMGNPHAVVFVDKLDKTPAAAWGPALETHPFFPKRTNVEFVEVLHPRAARVRVWERGDGFTLACGTGACAVGVAGVLTGRFHRDVTLALPGGTLRVEWAADNHVFLTGPAEFVFEGRLSPKGKVSS